MAAMKRKRSRDQVNPVIHRTGSERETLALARHFASKLRGGEVVALVGELGAGKTTFVRGLASYFGIREPVRSPTFTLMHVHCVPRSNVKCQMLGVRQLVHVDAYRIKNARELRAIGIEEYLGRPDTIVLIEWADRVRLDRVADYVIRFYHGKKQSQRHLEIKKRPDTAVGARDS